MFKIIENKDNIFGKVVFTIESGRGLANGIRRTLIGDLRMYALHNTIISINNSSVQDEKLRLSVEMIHVDNSKNITGVEFNMHVKATKDMHLCTSADLKSDNGKIYFEQDIPLCTLRAGQEIKLKSSLNSGYAKDHAKYSPVGLVGFKELDKVGKYKDKEVQLVQMTVNCVGVYGPNDLMNLVFNRMKELFEDFGKHLEEAIKNREEIVKDEHYRLFFVNGNETVGNIIKEEIEYLYPDNAFCSYDIRHPLTKQMVIDIANKGKEDPMDMLREANKSVLKVIANMEKDYGKALGKK
jgi:DNA-directed RNA polymerase subunit L